LLRAAAAGGGSSSSSGAVGSSSCNHAAELKDFFEEGTLDHIIEKHITRSHYSAEEVGRIRAREEM
jgi:hypothetical protein